MEATVDLMIGDEFILMNLSETQIILLQNGIVKVNRLYSSQLLALTTFQKISYQLFNDAKNFLQGGTLRQSYTTLFDE